MKVKASQYIDTVEEKKISETQTDSRRQGATATATHIELTPTPDSPITYVCNNNSNNLSIGFHAYSL